MDTFLVNNIKIVSMRAHLTLQSQSNNKKLV
jgi:hypothetical protein